MELLLPILLLVADLAARLTVAAIIILRSRGTPAVRMTWLVLLMAVPVVGVIAYLLFGEPRLGRHRVRRYLAAANTLRVSEPKYVAASPPVPADIPAEYRQIAHLAESVGGNIPQGGHALCLHGDTDLFIQALVEDLNNAKLHCHLLFYIFLTDHSSTRVAEALIAAAGRGVKCRLLVDGVGSRGFLRSELRQHLDHAGVRVVEALPANLARMVLARLDLRNHRKIVVIDGVVGYTGSQNIADAEFAIKSNFGPWVDATVRIEGPVVRDLQVLFVQDWHMDTHETLGDVLAVRPTPVSGGDTVQVIGTGPACYNEAMLQMTLVTMHTASDELIITTPYFVPDEATLAALYTCALRGVNVSLVVPARNDSPLVAAASRSYYAKLLDAGVTIHEYRAGLLHAKTITVDRRLAMITTANLDRRSFELNFEVSTMVYNSNFASQLRLMQKNYIDESDRVNATVWSHRGWPRKLVENGLGIFSPLL
jgi:cardiolipin synthase